MTTTLPPPPRRGPRSSHAATEHPTPHGARATRGVTAVIILGLETSGDACACAVLGDGVVLSERSRIAPREHTALLLPMVHTVLAEAGCTLEEVDRFAFGRGPGSFTGVRIAASVVQGLALARGREVAPVSSLAAAAMARAGPGASVLAAFDARMGEVYAGAFRLDGDGLAWPEGAEVLGTPDRVALPGAGDWIGVGPGWAVHGDVLAARMGPRLLESNASVLPTASAVCRLAGAAGNAVPAVDALPAYLRRNVASPRPGSSVGPQK